MDVGLPTLMGSPEDLLPSACAAAMIGKEAWVDLGPGSGEQSKGGNFLNSPPRSMGKIPAQESVQLGPLPLGTFITLTGVLGKK